MAKKVLLHVLYVAVIALYAFLIGCPFKRITGIDCPFCGMTRAYLAFVRGDFAGAFEFNRVFFVGIPLILVIAHLRLIKKRKIAFIAAVIFISLSAVALLINYILKFVL